MLYPMVKKHGQVHIGGHDIAPIILDDEDEDPEDFDDKSAEELHDKTYPQYAQKLLTNLYNSVKLWADTCPFCTERTDGKYPPPYRVNRYLDNISGHLIVHIRDLPPIRWKYFLSEYAKEYTLALVSPPTGGPPPAKKQRTK